MSLVISLTCALLATLLLQWARRYLKIITQSRYSPHKRARIRAFFFEGVEKRLLPWTVDALPTLLHLSLFLFFAGLVVFLCNINLTIFKSVLSWVGLCTALYVCFTCMPIIRHDSPYYTPLSLPTWHVVTGISFLVYQFLRWFNHSVRYRSYAYHRFSRLEDCYRKSLARGMQKTAEETALNTLSEIDARTFMWTFDCLDEDHELESFFSGLPGFCSSKVVDDPLPSLTEEERLKLYWALYGLLERTFSSDLLPAPVKDRRTLIGAKAVGSIGPPALHILDKILSRYRHSGPVATGMAKALRGWGNTMHEDTIAYAQLTIYKVLTTDQPRDDSWYNLASDELGFPETSLREYATQRDSWSLIMLIYTVRKQFSHFRKLSWEQRADFLSDLTKASKFDVKNMSSELQHEICTFWNQIVDKAHCGYDLDLALFILGRMRNAYLSLHQDTDSAPTQFSASTNDYDSILEEPSSYPVCKVPDHRSDLTSHTHDDGVSARDISHRPRDHNDTVFVPSITSPDPPPLSIYAPLSVITDALPLHNQISVPVSTQVAGQMRTEGHRIPTISPGPIKEPSGTVQPSTSGTSHKSNASASQLVDIAVGHSTLSRVPSYDLNTRSSPTPAHSPVLDAILPTGLLSFQAATRSDPSFSSPEHHSSILATTAEGRGSTKAGMSMGEDVSYSTLGVCEEITTTADIPPPADVVTDDPSMRSALSSYRAYITSDSPS